MSLTGHHDVIIIIIIHFSYHMKVQKVNLSSNMSIYHNAMPIAIYIYTLLMRSISGRLHNLLFLTQQILHVVGFLLLSNSCYRRQSMI